MTLIPKISCACGESPNQQPDKPQQARQTKPQQDPLPHASFSLPLAPLVPLHLFLPHQVSQPAVVFGQPTEVQALQQASHAHEDKEVCVRQDAQRQHGEADPKIHSLSFEHIVAHPLQFASGACAGCDAVSRRLVELTSEKNGRRGFRVVPMGWAGRVFRGASLSFLVQLERAAACLVGDAVSATTGTCTRADLFSM